MNISGGTYKGHKIIAPDERIVRPTLSKVRMSIFNTLFSILGDFNDKTFLDVFGGSGIMGLEAISRGFKYTTVFEKNRKVADIIKKNYSNLNLKPNLFIGDSLKLVDKLPEKHTVAYVDPPYFSGLYEDIMQKLSEHCDIIILERNQDVNISDYDVIKEKKYGDKIITYIKTNL